MSKAGKQAKPETSKADDLTQVILAIFRVNGRLVEWGDHFVAPLGVTSARWQMLGAIAMSGKPLSAPQTASTMGVTRQGAQKQLNLLLADELIEQLPNPNHLRSPLYRLSKSGDKLYRVIDREWTKAATRLVSNISSENLSEVKSALEQISSQLANDLKEGNP